MPHSVELDPTILEAIADQIAESFPPCFERFADVLEIGETFDVWTIASPFATTLTDAAEPTGAYHHQLLANGIAIGYARSWPTAGIATPEVTEVFVSPAAERIAESIDAADSEGTADVEEVLVRLLVAESYHVLALWFVDGLQRCFVVSAPPGLDDLTPRSFLNGGEFLRQIAKLKPIRGLVFDTPTEE
jgi:hypothetical protein